MIIVSAATGEYGRLVVDQLLNRVQASEIGVAVRNPAAAADLAARGVDVRRGDYDDPESLRQAFRGADRLLFISSPTFDSSQRMPQHHNVLAAARDVGVGVLAYTGALGADVSDEGGLADHHATERAIVDSELAYTILRHPIYSDFFLNAGLRDAVERGEITSSTKGRGLNTATRADLAAAAAVVLTGDGHASRAYDFAGPLWTYPELAGLLSELSGRTVTYREVDADEGMMEMIGPAIRLGQFERQTDDLERILGRPPTSLRASVVAAMT
jgi:NAD(P)H dehydrogenase (quinone)